MQDQHPEHGITKYFNITIHYPPLTNNLTCSHYYTSPHYMVLFHDDPNLGHPITQLEHFINLLQQQHPHSQDVMTEYFYTNANTHSFPTPKNKHFSTN